MWHLKNVFGMAALSYSFLDMLTAKDIIEGMPAGFRYSIHFFSCVYIMFQSLRGYERWRKERIENNHNVIEYEERKFEHEKKKFEHDQLKQNNFLPKKQQKP